MGVDIAGVAEGGAGLMKLAGVLKASKSGFLTAKGFGNLSESGIIDPKIIKFSQGSIGSNFKNGESVNSLVSGLKDGTISPSSIPAVRLVVKDGFVFTLDNRRLHAFQQANVPIQYEKMGSIPQNEMFKFKDYLSGKTDGSTIKVRGQ